MNRTAPPRRHRPLVSIVLAFATGVVCVAALGWDRTFALPLSVGVGTAALGLGAAVAWLARRGRPGMATWGLLALVLLLGGVRTAQDRLPIDSLQQGADALAVVVGTVVTYPIRTDFDTSFQLAPEGAPGRVAVFYEHARAAPVHVRYGDRVRLIGSFRAPEPFDGFDYPAYLARRDVWALAEVVAPGGLKRLERGGGWAPLRWGQALRDRLFARIETYVPSPHDATFKALLFGERAALPGETEANFRDAGVAHVLAVSGLHLGILIGLGWLGLRRLGLSAGATYGVLAAFVLVYLLLTGFKVSLSRAALLFAFVALGSVLKERGWVWSARVDPLQGLSAAGLLILFVQPQALFDAGFQLSFAAAGSILLALPALEALMARWRLRRVPESMRERTKLAFGRFALALAFVSLAAQLGVWPLVALHFGRLYLGTLLANLVVVPAVTLLLWLGAAALLCFSLPVPPLAAGAGALLGAGLGGLTGAVEVLARVPGMVWDVSPPPVWLLLPYFAGLIWFYGRLPRALLPPPEPAR